MADPVVARQQVGLRMSNEDEFEVEFRRGKWTKVRNHY